MLFISPINLWGECYHQPDCPDDGGEMVRELLALASHSKWWIWMEVMDTGWGSISPLCCSTSKSLATALTLLIRVCKSLKLLGKFLLKSRKEFAFFYQVYMHFSHLTPIAVLYSRAQVLLLLSFTKGRDWSQEGLDDRSQTVNYRQSTADCPLPLVSLLTCRWSCVISELLFPPPDTLSSSKDLGSIFPPSILLHSTCPCLEGWFGSFLPL